MPDDPTDGEDGQFAFRYSTDHTRVAIFGAAPVQMRVTPEMDAPVLDDLIQILVSARAGLLPLRVAMRPQTNVRAISGPGMDWHVEASGNSPGDVTLLVMHPGVGWIALPLSREAAGRLTKRILQVMSADPSPHGS
jgi:hypothetical protein